MWIILLFISFYVPCIHAMESNEDTSLIPDWSAIFPPIKSLIEVQQDLCVMHQDLEELVNRYYHGTVNHFTIDDDIQKLLYAAEHIEDEQLCHKAQDAIRTNVMLDPIFSSKLFRKNQCWFLHQWIER